MRSAGVGPAGRGSSLARLIRGPVVVGLPLGAVIGAVVGDVMRGNLAGGAVAGSVFASVVVAFVILSEVYTGALGVPRRCPFQPGDRFAGWTVMGRLRTAAGHITEYEVRRRDRRGKLTLSTLDDTSSLTPVSHALRQVQSRHLIHPLDLGRIGRFEYVVTELDRGESLVDRVRRAGVLTGEPLFAVAAGTAIALRDIHAAGAVHAQVRPDRVAVGGARVALYGFDPISRYQDANAFLAPEQTLDTEMATAMSDVFSWACTVFYAAVGRPPFTVPPDGEQEPRPDKPALDSCPEWVRPVLAEAFAGNPEVRPDSAAVLEQLGALGRRYHWGVVGPERRAAIWSRPPVRVPARGVGAALLAVLLTALLPAVVPAASGSTATPTSPVGPVAVPPSASATTTIESTTSTGAVTSTAPTTTTATAAGKWPATADDGSPAFHAYLGASFILPDWVACASGHCLVGSGDQIYVFTEHPINQIGQTNMAVQDPQRALIDMGLNPTEADSLLAR